MAVVFTILDIVKKKSGKEMLGLKIAWSGSERKTIFPVFSCSGIFFFHCLYDARLF
jgi:hypothetical protein